jgi:organic radical activating enzyme
MKLKGVRMEDFTNYKKPSMFLAFPSCNWKCERECGERVCQNSALAQAPDININISDLIDKYLANPITSAIVCGGLEPFNSWWDLHDLIIEIRQKTEDDIVIYTGFQKEEISYAIDWLTLFPNIIVKFGRFVPNQKPHYDEVLGVNLASDNQYAEVIS